MQHKINDFLAKVAVPPLVNVISMGEAVECRICVTGDKRSYPIWIDVRWAPPRHGCGWSQDALWARTNDADLFAGSHGPSFNEAKVAPQELIDSICAFLSEELKDCDKVEVMLIASDAAGAQHLPIMYGDSDTGELHENPQRPSF